MREKSTFILFVFLIILTLGILILFFILRFSKTPLLPADKQTPKQHITTPTPTFPVIPFDKPTTKTITISDVETQNFYTTGQVFDKNGDVSLEKNKSYEIVYLAPFQEFVLDIYGTPFENVRQQAEQDLLIQLGISKEQACKLSISESVHGSTPEFSGKRLPLSFCQNK